MPSPWRVLEVARTAPGWPAQPENTYASTGRVIWDVRAGLLAYAAGARGVAIERAVFDRRRDDPRDEEKRPSYDELPPQAKAEYAQLAGLITAAAATPGNTVKESRRGN
jgi:hypothetical protein